MSPTATLIAQYGFAAVVLVIFLGEIGIPILIPGEGALLLAGAELVHSPSELLLACVAAGAVDFTATCILHLAARSGGNRLLHFVLRRFLSRGKRPEDIEATWRARLSGRDATAIFVLRLVPGIRISASLGSGLLRLPLRHFLLGAAPASLLWAGVPLAAGYEMRRRLGALPVPDWRVVTAVALVCLVAVLLAGGRWWILRQRLAEKAQSHGAHRTAA